MIFIRIIHNKSMPLWPDEETQNADFSFFHTVLIIASSGHPYWSLLKLKNGSLY